MAVLIFYLYGSSSILDIIKFQNKNMKPYTFCQNYVKDIFGKWDTDNSGILERQELKNWLKEELKAKPLRKAAVREGFYDLVRGSDTNKDGKVDRW